MVGPFHFLSRLILLAKCLQCLFPMFDQLHIKVTMLCRYFKGFKNCKLSILFCFLDWTENKLITFFFQTKCYSFLLKCYSFLLKCYSFWLFLRKFAGNSTCKFFFLWNVIDLALTLRSFMSTLFPQSTIGMFSHTLTRSLCQLGTFLYVTRDVTSNMMIAHWPWI